MATAKTKAQDKEAWLAQSGKNAGGTITFVDPGGDDRVAWQSEAGAKTEHKNSLGQTYAQGTIEKGSHGSYAIYDGAQNYRGLITGDGNVYDGKGRDLSGSSLGAAALAALKAAGAELDGSSYADYQAGVEADRQAARENYQSGAGKKGAAKAVFAPQRGSADRDVKALLEQWKNSAQQQAQTQIDHATDAGVRDLQQGLEDAQEQFRRQQSQIAAEEAVAKDNAALYAQLRGDKGGIGAGQYSAVMNTAALKRQSVAGAQTKLSTDVARQIADLRAQGEFRKADAVLTLAQDYLSQLISLEKWAAEFDLDVSQFNESIRQWENNYQMKLAQYNDSLQKQWQEDQSQSLTEAGEALLKAGILPNDAQLSAMAMTKEQAEAYLTASQLGGGAKTGVAGGNWRGELYVAGKYSNTEAVEYLMRQYGLSRQDAQAWVYGQKGDASYAAWASSKQAQNRGGVSRGSTSAQLK